jgi:hypothetical protein
MVSSNSLENFLDLELLILAVRPEEQNRKYYYARIFLNLYFIAIIKDIKESENENNKGQSSFSLGHYQLIIISTPTEH